MTESKNWVKLRLCGLLVHTCAQVHRVAKYLLGKGLNHQIGRVGLEGGKEVGKKITVHRPAIATMPRISTFGPWIKSYFGVKI